MSATKKKNLLRSSHSVTQHDTRSRQESVSGLESALEVAQRACSPFLRWRPEALFFQAEVLERLGRKDEARAVYQRVLSEVRDRASGCIQVSGCRGVLL